MKVFHFIIFLYSGYENLIFKNWFKFHLNAFTYLNRTFQYTIVHTPYYFIRLAICINIFTYKKRVR